MCSRGPPAVDAVATDEEVEWPIMIILNNEITKKSQQTTNHHQLC